MTDSDHVPFITFLSDYGLHDAFVGICHGVIATICPDARVIDLTHAVARHDVRAGAIVLADALAYVPVGVHLAVVDPGVGAGRRCVALGLADGRQLVGPDNGLLWPAALAGGGVAQAIDVGASALRLAPVSATFHGRDIFAPVAAHLAAGVPLADAGEPLDPGELVSLELSRPSSRAGALIAHVRSIDRYGNVELDARPDQPADAELSIGGSTMLELDDDAAHSLRYVRTFADVGPGELLLFEDAQHRLAIAVNHGDAAAALGLSVGDEIAIRPA